MRQGTLPPVIAIDGPAASGKGTVAESVARALAFRYLDSGSLYRLVALKALDTGVTLDDEARLGTLAEALNASFEDGRIRLDGVDVTDAVRSEPVGAGASRVAVYPGVRTALLSRQRAFRRYPGLVADGRDMGTIVFPDEWLEKPGTVGKAWPISEVVVLDDEGNPLPAGEIGTVYMHMQTGNFEYYKDKEKTDKSRKGKYFTVGDIGYLDEDDYLFLCDRKADMIISGGANIYPAEIESVLLTHPKVGDAAVFGIPHEDWGEEVKAVIEPAPGVDPGDALADEILSFSRDKLAKFKMPKSIDFVAEMPRDPNGKLYKRKLRDPYWEGRERAI